MDDPALIHHLAGDGKVEYRLQHGFLKGQMLQICIEFAGASIAAILDLLTQFIRNRDRRRQHQVQRNHRIHQCVVGVNQPNHLMLLRGIIAEYRIQVTQGVSGRIPAQSQSPEAHQDMFVFRGQFQLHSVVKSCHYQSDHVSCSPSFFQVWFSCSHHYLPSI